MDSPKGRLRFEIALGGLFVANEALYQLHPLQNLPQYGATIVGCVENAM